MAVELEGDKALGPASVLSARRSSSHSTVTAISLVGP
jgi:hypothetical protein